MILNLKLGIILAALAAVSVLGAPAAQAASSLDVGATPAFLTGAQVAQNKLSITNGGVVVAVLKCSTATLAATTTAANVKEVTFAPEYNTCTKAGLAAVVKVNGCTYTLTGTAVALEWDFDIVCPAGKTMEIVQGSCITTIGSQGPLQKVTFANVAGVNPKHVLATLEVNGIAEVGNLGCPANLQGAHPADLTGTQTIKAFRDEGGVEGVQVSLEAT
jgi:hypothetical protein